MDGQQYLNQITASNRPLQKAGPGKSGISKILSSKFFLIGAIGVGVLIVIMIIGSILGGNKGGEKNLSIDLFLHTESTSEVIKTYQNDIKSSDLRSSAASLYSVLTTTNSDLSGYLEQKYNFKAKEIDKNTLEEAALAKDDLTNELFEAKINGILDRIFAHKMAYEITIILAEENKLADTSKNESLQSLLTKSYDSLTTLYDKFNDFSETK